MVLGILFLESWNGDFEFTAESHVLVNRTQLFV